MSRALLLELGAQAAPPQRPRHPQASPIYFTGDFCHPMVLFLPLREHVGKLLSQSFFGFAGAGDECAGFLGEETACINCFCEAEQNLFSFHPKAAGAGKHSQHEQAQCSFIIPVCMGGFINFSRKT